MKMIAENHKINAPTTVNSKLHLSFSIIQFLISFLQPQPYALSCVYWSCTEITCFILASVAVDLYFNADSGKEGNTYRWGNNHIFYRQIFMKNWPPPTWPISFFFISPVYVSCLPCHGLLTSWSTSYIIKGFDNIGQFYSCLINKETILDQSEN